ncbi:MAG: hypothetical protein ABIP89_06120 [Polyangiaceae bacterium]
MADARFPLLVALGVAGLAVIVNACGSETFGTAEADAGSDAANDVTTALLDAPSDAEGEGSTLDAGVPAVIATTQDDPSSLAADDTGAYWTNTGLADGGRPGALMRAAAGAVVTLSTGAGARGVSISASGALFAFSNDTVRKVQKTTGVLIWERNALNIPMRTAGSDQKTAITCLVDPGLEAVNGYVVRAELDGVTNNEKLDFQTAPVAVVLDGADAYWANWGTKALSFGNGSINRSIASDGGIEVMVSPSHRPLALAVDATAVYWTNSDGQLWRVNKYGPAMLHQLTTGTGEARSLELDDTWVYWTDYTGGAVKRFRKDEAGGIVILASGRKYPQGLAVTPDFIYWADRGTLTDAVGDLHEASDGMVLRLPK